MGLLDFLFGGSERERFAKAILDGVRRRDPATSVSYDKSDFAIRVADGGTMHLENMFMDWKTSGSEERARILARIPELLFESEEDPSWDVAAPMLIPVVRGRAEIAARRGRHPPVTEPFCEAYVVALVIDRELGMTYVTDELLGDWGVDFATARARALANLEALGPAKFARQPEGFHWAEYGDYHDASRMLLPSHFQGLDVSGDPVAIVVGRSTVLVGGSGDAAALDEMAALVADELNHDHRAFGCTPLVLRDGAWTRFEADQESIRALHALQADFDRAMEAQANA